MLSQIKRLPLVYLLLNIQLVSGAEVYYVLPDDASSTTCPSQPCATLSEYLQDNSTLSFVSDVEYQLLPGEHRVTRNIDIHHVSSFKLSGNPNTSLKCDIGVYIRIQFSSNFIITNMSIRKCGGNILNHVTSIVIQNCSFCSIVNVKIHPPAEHFSITGINMMGNCHFDNISILLNSSEGVCGKGISLRNSNNVKTSEKINSLIFINNLKFIARDTGCFVYDKQNYTHYDINGIILNIELWQNQYAVTVEVHNCTFRDMNLYNQPLMYTLFRNLNLNHILFYNCTFTEIYRQYLHTNNTDQALPSTVNIIHMVAMYINVAVKFTRCDFRFNDVKLSALNSIIAIHVHLTPGRFKTFFDTSIVINLCTFSYNVGSVLLVSVHRKVSRSDNYKRVVVYFEQTKLFNSTAKTFLSFSSCNIIFKGEISFLSNRCDTFIDLSEKTRYIQLDEYTNVTFNSNKCADELISVDIGNSLDTLIQLNPYCLFQYISSNVLPQSPPPTSHYHITVIADSEFNGVANYAFDRITAHCKWIPTAVYIGYRPGVVNEQIIDKPDNTLITIYSCYEICLCTLEGVHQCKNDVIGPVYPGQILTTSMSIVKEYPCLDPYFYHKYVASTLPASHCKVVSQEEWMDLHSEGCNPINLTIISNTSNDCEIFLLQPGISTEYTGFYVELMDCPVGFSLLNGICDCDPLLSGSELHIQACDIELAMITRPGNSWIYSQTMANGVKYLLSKCFLDYCLQQPLAINLSNPDLQCQFNRGGISCSQCKHGLSMVFGSSRCMKCTNVYLLVSLIIIVAGIILVVLMYVLNLTVTCGTINGFILYANIVSINNTAFLTNDNVFKPLKLFISFANLDLGIETCFYNGMDSYAKMWLQLFFPLYLIMIATFIIISSRHCYRIQRLTYTRSLPVLATLFLLSYMGILRGTSMVLFSYSTIIELPSGHQQLVWSIDASVPLFGFKFTILFITCLVLFLILFTFNFILLFARYLSKFKVINRFKPLLDAFQGPYKNGCYYWTAVHIIIRNILFSLYAINTHLRLSILAMLLVIFSITTGYVQPYKKKFVNIQELLLLTNISILYGTGASYETSGTIFFITNNFMIASSLLHFCAIMLYHFFTYTYHCSVIIMLQGSVKKLAGLLSHKRQIQANGIWLLDIPERTYNYKEYREGLVSDDFNS